MVVSFSGRLQAKLVNLGKILCWNGEDWAAFFALISKCPSIRKMDGRGGGDRNDHQTNKACALDALQPPPLANWNKRNKRQAQPSQVSRATDAESHQQPSVWLAPEHSTTRRRNWLAGVARFRSSDLLLRNNSRLARR